MKLARFMFALVAVVFVQCMPALVEFAGTGIAWAEEQKTEWTAENPNDHGISGADIVVLRNPDKVLIGAMVSKTREDLKKKVDAFATDCGAISFFINDEILPPKELPEKGPRSLSRGVLIAKNPDTWTYGPYAVVTFRPNDKCKCQAIKFVQFEKIKGVLTYKDGQTSPADIDWRIDALRDKDTGNLTNGPAYPGQIPAAAFKPRQTEEAMEDNPGFLNPWNAKNKDGSPSFPPGSHVDIEHDFISWIVCLNPAAPGTPSATKVIGAAKWGLTQHVEFGAGPDDTFQTVHSKDANGILWDENSDEAKLYRTLMAGFPDYLPPKPQ